MFRKLIAISLLASELALVPMASFAGQPAVAPEMAPLSYLVGTWHCRWQSGNASGRQDQVFRSVLGGTWLEEEELVGDSASPAVQSIHYTGYDPRTKMYVHVGPNLGGSYEIAQSIDGDTWTSTDGTLVHHKISDTRREMVETGPAGSAGPRVSMTCVKSAP